MKQDGAPSTGGARHDLARRAIILFLNFFLIILAYYQVKSASRSLLIEYWGSANLPYVWIVSALTLGTFIGFYHRLVERHSRLAIVLGSLILFIALLVSFRLLLVWPNAAVTFAFYIFVDILSVILVEQFWSLANTVNEAEDGKKTYWLVGSGVEHAVYVEEGRRPGRMPPPRSLLDWIKVARIRPRDPHMSQEDLAYVIARSIGRRGIPPRPFLERALERKRSRLQQLLDQAVQRAAGALA